MHTLPFHSLTHRILGSARLVMAWLISSHGPQSTLLGQTADPIAGTISEGYFWIEFSTENGQTYYLERSTDLDSWEALVTNIPGDGSAWQIVDPQPVSDHERGFYRLGHYSGPSSGEPPGNPDPNEWAWVPPGTFTLGSVEAESGAESDEGPPTVSILTQGLWASRFEVTQREYLALTSLDPSWFADDPDRPVENVSWAEATNYCTLLTAREQAAGRLPAGYVYRLPTEAEWEYACRAGSTTAYAFGDGPAAAELGFYAWYADNSGSTNPPPGFSFLIGAKYYTTQPVGTRQPNRWGLYDLPGSLWEWCLDWYQSAYPGGTVTNYAGPDSGTARVIRGGSWNSGPASCRSANRSAGLTTSRSSGIGFRLVLAPQ